MTDPFSLRELTEGRARLLVPDVPRRKGPGAKGPWPFYNPTMVVNRDLSAVALARWPHPLRTVLDGLAATGVWGIRMALETGATGLVFNDRSPAAEGLIRRNLALNSVDGEILVFDLRSLLPTRMFDYVDIDPFGPPTPFLEAAIRSARASSGLGITATDTASLSGTYPSACLRRYGARPLRCPQSHEIGLRILLAYCARAATAEGKRIRPLLSFAAEHFLRIHLVVESQRPEAAAIGSVQRDPSGAFLPARSDEREAIGPLWLGPLSDPSFVRGLAPSEWTRSASARILDLLQREADMSAFFVTTDELAERLRESPPKMDRFLDALHNAGFRATRTHFDSRGVKTDAPHEEIVRLFRGMTV